MNFLRFISAHPSLWVLALLVVLLFVAVWWQEGREARLDKARRAGEWAQFQRDRKSVV